MLSPEKALKLTKPHFSCKVYRAYLDYLQTHHPQVDLERLAADAGLSLDHLKNENEWVSVMFDQAFTKLAIERSGEVNLAFKVGAHAATSPALHTMFHLVVSRCFPLLFIYKNIPRVASIFSKVTRTHTLSVKGGRLMLRIEAISDDLDDEEKAALEQNFENIFQNTMGYYCYLPVNRKLPPADLVIETEKAEGSILQRTVSIRLHKTAALNEISIFLIAFSVSTILAIFAPTAPSIVPIFIIGIWILFSRFNARADRRKFDQTIQHLQQLDQRYAELFASKEDLRKLSEIYSRFVPWQVLKLLQLQSPTEFKLGQNITRILTVMFIDIRGFSQLAERLPPETTMQFLNDFFATIAPNIEKTSGFVDSYIGDGLMAIFPHRPDDAIEAALEIRATLERFNQSNPAFLSAPLKIGIGINTGRLTLGLVGYENHFQVTAISDVVNTAARLESYTKKLGSDTLVGEMAYQLMEGSSQYTWRSEGEIELEGKEVPIKAFSLLGKTQMLQHPLQIVSFKRSDAEVADTVSNTQRKKR